MAGFYDDVVADQAKEDETAARAAQPGSTLAPPNAAPPVTMPSLLAGASDATGTEPNLTPAPQTGGSFYDDVVSEQRADDTRILHDALDIAKATDPKRYNEAAVIAARDGLDPKEVAANLDDFKKRATGNDMRKALEANPKLKEFFLTGDNAARLKLDDLAGLNGLTWLGHATADAWNEGWQQRDLAQIRYRQLRGRATPEEIRRADEMDAKSEPRDFGATGFVQGMIPALAQQLPNMAAGFGRGIQEAPYGMTLGAAVGAAAGSVAGGIGALPGAAAGIASGAASGMILGRTKDAFEQEAGSAFGEFLQFRGDHGEKVDEDTARGAAMVVGAANAALETIGEAALEKIVPGLDKFGVGALLRSGSRAALKEAMKVPTTRAALQTFGKNIAKGMGTEISTEVAQEAMTILGGIVTRAQSPDSAAFQRPEAGQIGERLGDTALQTAQAMGALVPALSASRLGNDLRRAQKSAGMREVYANADNLAASSELRSQDPAQYGAAVKAVLDRDGMPTQVMVPVEKMTELFQSMNLTPADMDARIDGFSQRYAEAEATGSDVHIDLADYQAHIAGTDLGKALLDHQRWHPDMMTVSEANEALADAKQAQEAEMERISEEVRREIEAGTPHDQIADMVYGQLVNAGQSSPMARAEASLYGAFSKGTLGRAGVDPVAFMDAMGLEVRRPEIEGLSYQKTDELDLALDAVRRGEGDRAARKRQRGRGPTLGGYLRTLGGLRETDSFAGELRARDLGKLRASGDAGLDLDAASLAAMEAGYFPNRVREGEGGLVEYDRAGAVDDLLAAIDEEQAGRPSYAVAAEDVQMDPQLARLEALAQELSTLGLDPASMTNAEIRAELVRASNPDAEQGALFQGGARPSWMEEIFAKSAERKAVASRAAAGGGTVRLKHDDGRSAAAGPDMSKPGTFRLTRLDKDGPVGHTEHASLEDAVLEGMRAGYNPAREFFQTAGKGDLAGDRGDKRGSIQFGNGRTIINLFRDADASTFLHETGHFFYEALDRLAAMPDAPQQIRDDLAAMDAFTGREPGKPIARDAHEKFATAFEAYLLEGKAPSTELQAAFEKFAFWLKQIYVKATGIIGLPAINADVRGVFDRMLATEEEINSAQADPSFVPMFKEQAASGMTDAQWLAYNKQADAATNEAKGILRAKLMQERRREMTKEWKKEKTAVREEVRADLLMRPVYQVAHFIRTGEDTSGLSMASLDLKDRRLSRDWIVKRFGKDALARLPGGVPPIYNAKGGLNPDEIAEWFGFNSGEEMIVEMMSAPAFGRAVTAQVNSIMRERHGDLMSNQAALAEETGKAVDNDARGTFLHAELKALSSNAKGKGGMVPTRQVVREMARGLIRSKTAYEAGRVNVHQRNREKAAREAQAAILAGDFEAAANAKRRELLHHYLVQESRKAKEETESTRAYLDKFVDRKTPGGIDPDYLDQITAMLERFEFKRSTTGRQLERREGLLQFVERQMATGDVFNIPPEVLADAQLKSYKTMTVNELAALRDMVKNIEHLGRLKNRLLEKGRLVSFQERRDELVAQAYKTPTKKGIKHRNANKVERFTGAIAGLVAYSIKIEFMVDWLDQGDINGPFRRIVWQRFVDAQNQKGELQKRFADKLNDIMSVWKTDYLLERKAVPLRPSLSFTRMELIVIALHQGTESNRQKILNGEMQLTKDRTFHGEAEMESALSLLSKEDWDTVQKIWDLMGELWPETAALERRVTGVSPEKQPAREVVTKFGTLRGGYYPMIYDPKAPGSFDVAQRVEKASGELFDNGFANKPTVQHGFTKSRVENYSRPVYMDLNGITRHLDETIQNLTHREAVRDTLKLFQDKQFQVAIEDVLGPAAFKNLYAWLNRVASDRGPPPADDASAQFFAAARANVAVVSMGYRVTTALSQLAGLFQSWAYVKAPFLGGAFVEAVRHPVDTWNFISEKSGQMRDRTNNMDRDMRAAIARLEGKTGIVHAVKRSAFYMTAMFDKFVSGITWLGAYNEHLSLYPTDENGAVMNGDRAVNLSQGSGAPKDLSAIMGNKNDVSQTFTLFYGFFNTYLNQLLSIGRDIRTSFRNGAVEDVPHIVARIMATTILPAVGADLIVGKLWDDDENKFWWAFRKATMYPLMAVPWARDVAGALESSLGYQLSPLGRYGDLTTRLIQMGIKGVKGEDVDGRIAAKNAAELTGYVFGLPLGQVVGTGSNIWQGLEQHDLKPKDLLFNRRAFGDQRDK